MLLLPLSLKHLPLPVCQCITFINLQRKGMIKSMNIELNINKKHRMEKIKSISLFMAITFSDPIFYCWEITIKCNFYRMM